MKDLGTMKRRRSLVLKVTAVGFIILMLFRTDWLTAVFTSSSPAVHVIPKNHLIDDRVHLDADEQKESVVRDIMEKERHMPDCPIPHLKNKLSTHSNTEAYCQRIQPFKSTCRVAEELFGDPLSLQISKACRTHHEREFCRILGSVDKWTTTCDISVCDKHIYLGIKDVTNGKLTWTSFKRNKELQRSIQGLIVSENFGYCLIACSKYRPHILHYDPDYADTVQDEPLKSFVDFHDNEPQILNLPPMSPESQPKHEESQNIPINLNFIFIDSVSRHHFYRSLPRSVKKLDEIATSNNKEGKLLVLDYELVQGVRSRTFENLQTFFSGQINPFEKPFGTLEMPRERLKVDHLLVPLKTLGYKSLWLEDLCPYWEWGISKDLLVYNKNLNKKALYKKLIDLSRKAGIDSLGNTFSSCDILNANDVPDPFHAPEKLCYNGKHQHEYTLSYLETYQRVMAKRSQPFISFFETNVGHEGTGKRVQYFDSALALYLSFAKDLTNTLTIIWSDHGNAYGDFLTKSREGRIEIFHPLLFMIIPDKVRAFFNERHLLSLKVNQKRLISVLDLHYTLTYIIEMLSNSSKSNHQFNSEVSDFNKQFNVSRYGLLSEISPVRTCSHMPRIMPNACICKGYDVTLDNKANHFILAAYFIGTLNNNIQKLRLKGARSRLDSKGKRKGRQFGGFGNCKRMKVKKIKNILESHPKGYLTAAKMDLYVETDGQVMDEIFFISVQMKNNSRFSNSSFERVTPYSKYSKCADTNVDAKLCICQVNASKDALEIQGTHNPLIYDRKKVEKVIKSMLYPGLTNNITLITVHGQECLYIVSQSNKAGIIYDTFNNCKVSFKVKFLFKTRNLILSSGNSVHLDMLPNDSTFVTAGVSESGSVWSCELSVRFAL